MGDAWVVGLAAPFPSQGTAGGGGAPPAAKAPPPPASGVKLSPEKPPAAPAERKGKEKEKKKPEAKPSPAPTTTGPATPQGPASSPAGGPGPGGPSAPGIGAAGGTGIFSMDAAGSQFAWYRATVVASLQSHWNRPVLEDVRGTLTVTVTFEVDRDGTLRNVEVAESSGVPSLDRSALAAVIDASPLPPLPSGWGQPPFSARFEFRYSPGNP
jgi:periplasmic protein TonB